MTILRAAWATLLLSLGALLFVAMTFSWAVISLVLGLVLPGRAGRRAGRLGAMYGFRIHLGIMQALGAWRLDLSELDSLRGQGALIVAANHPSLLDAVLVVSRLPDAVCVMKRSLLGNFLLGPAARLARYVRNDSLLRLVASAEAQLRDGGQLLLFPEGTRTVAPPTGPFTDAVGAVARRAHVPVQTVIIEADSAFLGKGRPLLDLPRFPLHYRARLGRRFEAPSDVRAFTAELHSYFEHQLRERAVPQPHAAHPELQPERARLP
jgi:1-acyl-sn-glycerol-3-phosphate acyltransferase